MPVVVSNTSCIRNCSITTSNYILLINIYDQFNTKLMRLHLLVNFNNFLLPVPTEFLKNIFEFIIIFIDTFLVANNQISYCDNITNKLKLQLLKKFFYYINYR